MVPDPIRQLPHDVAGFCGRAELAELNRLVPAIEDERHLTAIVAIDGAPGTGKTTIAVHWAHQVAHAFPNLQLYVNLRGYGPGSPMSPSAAAESLLRSLGVHSDTIPPRSRSVRRCCAVSSQADAGCFFWTTRVTPIRFARCCRVGTAW